MNKFQNVWMIHSKLNEFFHDLLDELNTKNLSGRGVLKSKQINKLKKEWVNRSINKKLRERVKK